MKLKITNHLIRPGRIQLMPFFLAASVLLLSCQQKSGEESSLSDSNAFHVSGRYPHLAMFSPNGECGTGAVVSWCDHLWAITYSPHKPFGSADGLYEITPDLQQTKRPESIGGTPANRMIHRESRQLFIGPYAIDTNRNVRVIPYERMPGRPTANARHLEAPAQKIYYLTMEEGLYSVDVQTLEVDTLFLDENAKPDKDFHGERLPGYHGKGAYTAQNRLVYSLNGKYGGAKYRDFSKHAGSLCTWDGEEWNVIQERQFTEVTGPGGIKGNPSDSAQLWSVGWDHRSIILKLLDHGEWFTYRLPKADYSYDGLHGWHTEWPRIRQVGPEGQHLMNMHGMWYQLNGNFSKEKHPAPQPIASYLKITGDFARWQDMIVFGCDDAATNRFTDEGQNLVGQSQSNLWFTKWEQLKDCGSPYAWGGPWVHDTLKSGTVSDPFSIADYTNRQLHLSHHSDQPKTFALEYDPTGKGAWKQLTELKVPAKGYKRYVLKPDLKAEWIRIISRHNASDVTAYFHMGKGGGSSVNKKMFSSLASPGSERSVGLLRPKGNNSGVLQFAARKIKEDGSLKELGYYEIDEEMNFDKMEEDTTYQQLQTQARIQSPDFEVTTSSIVLKGENGIQYHLPRGDSAFDEPSEFGWPRTRREVVTERDLLNAHGTFYVLPRALSGGVSQIKPIATHNKQIVDYCSWRGLLVLSGCNLDKKGSKHFIKSNDGKAGLWFGDVDDLWKIGKPKGQGGPWKNSAVKARQPSDPYLMTGYDNKQVTLSHNYSGNVTFTLEIDVLGDGSWHKYKTITVKEGEKHKYKFPDGFSAHWVRLKTNHDCKATAWFVYN